jgi:uncharacterized protein YneF (UPF0154 family)
MGRIVLVLVTFIIALDLVHGIPFLHQDMKKAAKRHPDIDRNAVRHLI